MFFLLLLAICSDPVASGPMEQHLTAALRILSTYCELDFEQTLSRIAPIEYKSLGPTVLMQTRATFVLRDAALPHWVPLCLALMQARDTTHRAQLLLVSEYDTYITVNTDTVSSQACLTSLFLHELLHALGAYSLVNKTTPGGFLGAISLYDSLLRYTGDGQLVFDDVGDVQSQTGDMLGGQALSIGPHAVYNPPDFVTGVSLFHLDTVGIMAPQNGCDLELDEAILYVLANLGWREGGCQPCSCIIKHLCLSCDAADNVNSIVEIVLFTTLVLCIILLFVLGSQPGDTYGQNTKFTIKI
jgi:hypothetical protein